MSRFKEKIDGLNSRSIDKCAKECLIITKIIAKLRDQLVEIENTTKKTPGKIKPTTNLIVIKPVISTRCKTIGERHKDDFVLALNETKALVNLLFELVGENERSRAVYGNKKLLSYLRMQLYELVFNTEIEEITRECFDRHTLLNQAHQLPPKHP